MKLSVFGSSSSGNGYALELNNGKILLIECGVPLKKFMEAFPNRWDDILGCLVTHEHKDHAWYAREYVKAGIVLYSAKETLEKIDVKTPGKTVALTPSVMRTFPGRILLFPFKVVHNALNPLAFMIVDSETQESMLFMTDTAYLEYRFMDIDYMVVECNNIEEISQENFLQGNRATSQFHMSLETLKKFLANCDTKKTKEIILIHLSDRNSHEERMIREISEQTGIKTSAALPGQVYDLRKDPF